MQEKTKETLALGLLFTVGCIIILCMALLCVMPLYFLYIGDYMAALVVAAVAVYNLSIIFGSKK